MSNGKPSPEFDIFTTDDGSPTMRLGCGEKMHSLAGAFSESLYIYGHALEQCLALNEPRVLSMGLGLGYNELITIGLFHQQAKQNFEILSFELVPFLRESFLAWINQDESDLMATHSKLAGMVADHFGVSESQLRKLTQNALDTKRLVLASELPSLNPMSKGFHCLFYDAFSGESDPELWSQNHLEDFLQQYADPEFCCFTTYAATGNLNRALKSQGFLLEKRKGFGHKRESTLALRRT